LPWESSGSQKLKFLSSAHMLQQTLLRWTLDELKANKNSSDFLTTQKSLKEFTDYLFLADFLLF
jgi:ABC-type uncharacterized transport system substrate-binding protein